MNNKNTQRGRQGSKDEFNVGGKKVVLKNKKDENNNNSCKTNNNNNNSENPVKSKYRERSREEEGYNTQYNQNQLSHQSNNFYNRFQVPRGFLRNPVFRGMNYRGALPGQFPQKGTFRPRFPKQPQLE